MLSKSAPAPAKTRIVFGLSALCCRRSQNKHPNPFKLRGPANEGRVAEISCHARCERLKTHRALSQDQNVRVNAPVRLIELTSTRISICIYLNFRLFQITSTSISIYLNLHPFQFAPISISIQFDLHPFHGCKGSGRGCALHPVTRG